jgi:RNA recognition motif-containing protein
MSNEDARKLFVAGLPDSVTEEDLRGLFLESGAQSAELTLPRDRMSGRPRGFAFVRLGSEEEADRARSVLDGRIVDGRTISVRPFQAEPPARGERPMGGPGMGAPMGGGYGAPREDRPRREMAGGPAPDRTLYVGNLPYDATQEEIEVLLNELGAGPVARVHLPLDQDGRKRGFGFVTLATAEAANAAIDQLKNAELRSRRLIINLAHPKGTPGAPMGAGGPGGFTGTGGERPPPRTFGAAPGSNFGPPSPPGGRAGLANQRKRKEGEGDGRGRPGAAGATAGASGRRDREEKSWRDDDED